MENEHGEGSIRGQIIQELQEYEWNGIELNNELLHLCGEMNNPLLAMVNVVGEEFEGSEPL